MPPLGLGVRNRINIVTQPTFGSASNVGIVGGNSKIFGTGFQSGCVVALGSGIGAVSVTFNSSTSLTITVPAESAGLYDIWIANPDGGVVFAAASLVVTASSDPSTIFGANLVAWFRADTGTVVSGNFTAVTDKSASGNAPTTLTNVAYTANDGYFNNEASFGFNGTNSVMSIASLALGTHTAYCAMAIHLLAAGNTLQFIGTGNRYILGTQSTTGVPTMGASGFANWPSGSVVNTSCSVDGYYVGTGSSTGTYGVAVNGGTFVSAAGTALQPDTTGDIIAICSNWNGSAFAAPFANAHVADIVMTNVVPTISQHQALAQYFNLRYQLSSPPAFTEATVINTNSGAQQFRISGANFINGCTVSGAGIGALTVNYLSSTVIECTVPAGTYSAGTVDITITNPDGGSTLINDGLVITTATDPMSIMGTKVQLWMQGDQVTQVAGVVSAFKDKSLVGNTTSSHTSVSWTSADAAVNNQPYVSYNGSTSFSSQTLPMVSGQPLFIYCVARLNATSVNATFNSFSGVDTLNFQANSGTVGINFGGTTTAWTGSSGTSNAFQAYIYETGGGSWTQAVNVTTSGTWGTEQTSSVTSTALGATNTFFWGKRAGGNFINDRLFCTIVCNVKPSSTELTALASWAHTTFGV